MTDYTHYSLFDGHHTVRDFAALPAGGLRELLCELHQLSTTQSSHCVAIGRRNEGFLHPKGDQVSFSVGERYLVILMSHAALRSQAVCLASEGNIDSAETAAHAAEHAIA